MAAALAFNGGIIALLIALPASHYLRPVPGGPIEVRFVPIDPVPPPPQPAQPETSVRTQPTHTVDRVEDPVRVDPQIDLGTSGDLTLADFPPPAEPNADARVVELPPPVLLAAQPDPRFADRFRPPYPPAMQREGLEGSVTVRVSIDARGRVTAVEQVSATHPAFFEAARRHALRAWRFRPATRDGAPVASEQVLTLRFQLDA